MNQVFVVFLCMYLNMCFHGLMVNYEYIIIPLLVSMVTHMIEKDSCYEDIYWSYILSLSYHQIP